MADTTVTVKELFSGSRYTIKQLTGVGGEGVADIAVLAAGELNAPNGKFTGADNNVFGQAVLVDAVWNIDPDFDNLKLYYQDETNDLVILRMTGTSSLGASSFGGISAEEVADEGNTAVDEDYVVEADLVEDASAEAGASAAMDVILVFKHKDIPV